MTNLYHSKHSFCQKFLGYTIIQFMFPLCTASTLFIHYYQLKPRLISNISTSDENQLFLKPYQHCFEQQSHKAYYWVTWPWWVPWSHFPLIEEISCDSPQSPIRTCVYNSFYTMIRSTNATVKPLTIIFTLMLPVYLLDNQKWIAQNNREGLLHHCCNRS